jgi:hypothetical protein
MKTIGDLPEIYDKETLVSSSSEYNTDKKEYYCCGVLLHKVHHILQTFISIVFPQLSANHSWFIHQSSLQVTSKQT